MCFLRKKLVWYVFYCIYPWCSPKKWASPSCPHVFVGDQILFENHPKGFRSSMASIRVNISSLASKERYCITRRVTSFMEDTQAIPAQETWVGIKLFRMSHLWAESRKSVAFSPSTQLFSTTSQLPSRPHRDATWLRCLQATLSSWRTIHS